MSSFNLSSSIYAKLLMEWKKFPGNGDKIFFKKDKENVQVQDTLSHINQHKEIS